MKAQPQKSLKTPKLPQGNDEGGGFVDRKLMKIDPKREQFEPTEAEPVRARFRMGGGC